MLLSRRTCEWDGVSFQPEPVNDACGRVMCDQLAVLEGRAEPSWHAGGESPLALVRGHSPPS